MDFILRYTVAVVVSSPEPELRGGASLFSGETIQPGGL